MELRLQHESADTEARIAELEAEVRRLRARLDAQSDAADPVGPGEDKFRVIADSIDQMIWSTRPDGFHDYFNRRWYDFTGMPEGTTDGEVWNDMFHPDDRERAWETWRRSLATGDTYEIEYRLRHRSGDYRWVLGRAQPVRDADGAIRRWYGTCTDIHDFKVAEAALRESQARLKTLTNNIPGVMIYQVVTSRDMSERRYVYVSDNAEAVVGVPAAAAMADPGALMGRINPNEIERVLAAERRAAAAMQTLDIEIGGDTARGSIRTRIISQPRPLLDGRLLWDGIVIDMTERQREQEQAGRTAALLSAIGEATPDLIFAKDRDFRLIYANPATCATVGIPADRIVGTSNRELARDRKEAEAFDANDRAVMDSGRTQVIDEVFTAPDGRRRTYRSAKTPIRNAAGEVIGVAGVSSDVTERVEAVRLLRASEARLRFLSDLDEALRGSHDAPTAMYAAAGVLARRLETSRCAYAAVDADNDSFTIFRDYLAPGVASSAGTYSLDLFGPRAAADMREGRTLVIRDVGGELAPGEGRETFHAIGIDAIVCCPLVKGGCLVAMMAVHQDRPRDWADEEIELVEASVERCWTHVERVGAEARLRESEARLRAIFDATPECIKIVAPDGSLMRMNHAGLCMIEAPGAEPVDGACVFDLISPEHREEWKQRHARIVAGESMSWEFDIIGLGGTRRRMETHAVPLPLPDDSNAQLAVTRDITARKETEDALRESEERLRELADNIDQFAWTADKTGWIHWYNQRWYDYTGTTPEQMEGWGWTEVHHPDHVDRVVRSFSHAVATGENWEDTFPLKGADGTYRWFLSRAKPIRDGAGEVVRWFGTNTDVEQLRAVEQQLLLLNENLEQRVAEEVERRSAAEEALRQAQKMETLGQLTGGVAHDFNNLLQIVTGNIDLIQRGLPDDAARLRRAAENAARGAERAAVLTQRLLAFARRQPLAPKPLDPNRLVSGMSELLYRTLGETIEIETVLASGLWTAEADPNQLENAILNLAVNARDAMTGGGKLTIETSNAHLDRGYTAQNAGVPPGQYVAICVSDTGVGMDEDTVARAFEPFFTTKDVGKGTGLGLSMVYGFVKQSGGHLKIYSEVGHGTTVKIYLPRLHAGELQADEQEPEDTPEGGENETVLVCEDDDDVRAYTVEVLRELGYRVLEAHDGPSALRLLERQEEPVDLLFTDVVLPSGMTGADLARKARAVQPDLKVLFTTGYARNAIVHHGRLDPGVELLTKPFSYSDLAARVRDLLDGVPGSA